MNSTTPLRVGIIGAGFVSVRSHIPGYQRLPDVEVVALCDTNEARAQEVAQRFGIPHVFTDYRDLLAFPDLDVVSVCVPNALHAEITIAALDSGRHVLCEKPMAITVAQAEAMAAAAERNNRLLTLGLHFRFAPHSRTLKRLIQAGALGDIYLAQISLLRRSGIPGYGSWFTNRDLAGGGVLLDLGVHLLDLILYLMDFPTPVSVMAASYDYMGTRRRGVGRWGADIFTGPARFDVDDLSTAFVRFANGATLVMTASWAGYSRSEYWMRLMGTEGGAEFSPDLFGEEHPLHLFSDLHGAPVEIIPETPRPKDSHQYHAFIEAFVKAIREGSEPPVTPQQGVLVTRVLDAMQRSAQQRHEVQLR